MAHKYLAFDIETARVVPGPSFQWRAHRPLGITCIASLSEDDDEPRVWLSRTPSGTPAPQMTPSDTVAFVEAAAGTAYSSPADEGDLEPAQRTWRPLRAGERVALGEGAMVRTGGDGTIKVLVDPVSAFAAHPEGEARPESVEALARTVRDAAGWLDLDEVHVAPVGDLAGRLRGALRRGR